MFEGRFTRKVVFVRHKISLNPATVETSHRPSNIITEAAIKLEDVDADYFHTYPLIVHLSEDRRTERSQRPHPRRCAGLAVAMGRIPSFARRYARAYYDGA